MPDLDHFLLFFFYRKFAIRLRSVSVYHIVIPYRCLGEQALTLARDLMAYGPKSSGQQVLSTA